MVTSLFSDVLEIVESIALWLIESIVSVNRTGDRVRDFENIAAAVDVTGQLTLENECYSRATSEHLLNELTILSSS